MSLKLVSATGDWIISEHARLKDNNQFYSDVIGSVTICLGQSGEKWCSAVNLPTSGGELDQMMRQAWYTITYTEGVSLPR